MVVAGGDGEDGGEDAAKLFGLINGEPETADGRGDTRWAESVKAEVYRRLAVHDLERDHDGEAVRAMNDPAGDGLVVSAPSVMFGGFAPKLSAIGALAAVRPAAGALPCCGHDLSHPSPARVGLVLARLQPGPHGFDAIELPGADADAGQPVGEALVSGDGFFRDPKPLGKVASFDVAIQ
jgi:hypothetical protein